MKRVMKYGYIIAGLLGASVLWGQMLEMSSEWLEAEDVRLMTGSVSGKMELSEGLELRTEWAFNSIDFDYRPDPIDFSQMGGERNEENQAVSLRLRKELGKWRIEGTGTYYRGYRSLSDAWLDEFYGQKYGANVLPGVHYEVIEPRGYGGTVSTRWEYLKSTGYVSLGLGMIQDRVAPSYEIDDLLTFF